MSAGREGDHLVAVVRELYTEFGYAELDTEPHQDWLQSSQTELWEGCGDGSEDLVSDLRKELARLAHATQGEESPGQARAVRAALDGAEMVMRSEMVARGPKMIGSHLPGFIFMVALPGLGHGRALSLSRRTAELVDRGTSED